jgi:hypothetical protein
MLGHDAFGCPCGHYGLDFPGLQPLMKSLVVFRMLVASWEDMLGESLLVSP